MDWRFTSSSQEMSKPLLVPHPDPIVECWEELASVDNDATEMHENELTCL